MFVLVTGGSGSGKSAYAESRVLGFGLARRYYIATMECFDEESRRRVERHRKMRAGKGFETIEQPYALYKINLLKQEKEESEKKTALLECMSNLAANEVFDPAAQEERKPEDRMMAGIDRLLRECNNLVVVTNEVFSDGVNYPAETEEYLRVLGEVNRRMAERADEVIEVVYGIPVVLKKDIHCQKD